jgi:hypothetical protein
MRMCNSSEVCPIRHLRSDSLQEIEMVTNYILLYDLNIAANLLVQTVVKTFYIIIFTV